ncbi:alcohol dehydrogenase [Breoghania sp. L-A4]|uniref:alcohol dehydrogenase n=1 Tax=Breoghania sp. L-A4 TaxID=2304600 RepID=UPI000E35F493|nr:alcohol dehydrogenase [Breoghania sp. L-A4]AXS40600.1 alcohol dehydrogenase [Breoghania sp. L-A4]
MQNQSIIEYGAPLAETSAETPAPTGTEVLIQINHCGVCHSDVHIHDGHFDLGGGKQLDVRAGRELPFTLGHEIEGSVCAMGPDATGVTIGKRAVVYPWIGCGDCPTCAEGDEHLCAKPRQLGINVNGGYSTHVMVPHPRYLLNYDGIDPRIAGSFMCSGLTAYSALKRLEAQAKRGPLLLVGLGGVGMMGLAFARALFEHAPYVADIDPAKRRAAMGAGAAAAFDPSDREARKAFLAQTGGVFGAVDFAGAESSLNFAQSVLRKSGKVVVAGLIGGSFTIPIPMFAMRVIGIEGSFVGSLPEAREMLEIVRAGKVSSIPVETRPLSAANQALDDLRAGTIMGRVVLEI